jgi:DNA-binding winged helix-turn-helix (wHTH) protein
MKAKFGEFEFDAVTGELSRRGEPVRLQAQPARVLAILVEHAGQVVTRDALREAIWGGDTFVDFDKGLNFAIAQVRTALGDSADAPSFVRTLPKRGYQFIAPIEVADKANRIDSESAALDLDAGAARPRLSVVNGGSAVRWTVVAVAILCVAAASAWWASRSTLRSPHSSSGRVRQRNRQLGSRPLCAERHPQTGHRADDGSRRAPFTASRLPIRRVMSASRRCCCWLRSSLA